MPPLKFEFSSNIWVYQGKGGWHFISLPARAADEIRFFNPDAKGFTPLKVLATIGKTSWQTAIFPDAASGSFILAIKADVREAENLNAGDTVKATVEVVSDG